MAAKQVQRHPGETLGELLAERGVTLAAFADHIGVGRNIVSRVINGRSDVSPAMALRIVAALGGDPLEWIQRQGVFDLAATEVALKDELKQIKRIPPAEQSAGKARPGGRSGRR